MIKNVFIFKQKALKTMTKNMQIISINSKRKVLNVMFQYHLAIELMHWFYLSSELKVKTANRAQTIISDLEMKVIYGYYFPFVMEWLFTIIKLPLTLLCMNFLNMFSFLFSKYGINRTLINV